MCDDEDMICEVCQVSVIQFDDDVVVCEMCGRQYGRCCACEHGGLNLCYVCEERMNSK